MTEKILKACKQKLTALKLVPSDGGRFEISVNGSQVYSKLSSGQFPNEEQMVSEITSRC